MPNITIPESPYGQGENIRLAAEITKAGSKQTYYTFLLLADRDRVQDAFRSYAYFRWLDDLLDCEEGSKQEKVDLVHRQQTLLESCYRGEYPREVKPEEGMLVDLIRNDRQEHSGLHTYLGNMMAVMAFDVERCGRLITNSELAEYTHLLSSAVTEVLFYLIGHNDPPPCAETRYHAVNGAHVVHMLRDTLEDISTGYINIPAEYLQGNRIGLDELHSPPIRKWVFERVKLAGKYFDAGRGYIAQVKNLRCRLAGFAYIARFEWMLRVIEGDGYCLRPAYPERKSLRAVLWMLWRVITSSLRMHWSGKEPARRPTLTGECEEG